MNDLLLLLCATVLLTGSFVMQKAYQNVTVGVSGSDIKFNIFTTIVSLFVFVATNKFHFEISTFSVVNSILKSACGLAYTLIGFKILAEGNIALYMLFLMSGGMVIPSVYGWLFLGEEVLWMRVAGVILICLSIVLSNSGAKRPDKKLLFLCICVFFLNGGVSVFSKLHQIGGAYGAVDTASYAVMSAIISLVMSIGLLKVKKEENTEAGGKSFWKSWAPALAVLFSVLGSISSLLQLEGAKNLPASVLYPVMTGGSIVLTGIFGMICFKEQLSKREWAGILVCFIGTCLFI